MDNREQVEAAANAAADLFQKMMLPKGAAFIIFAIGDKDGDAAPIMMTNFKDAKMLRMAGIHIIVQSDQPPTAVEDVNFSGGDGSNAAVPEGSR